MMAMMLLNEFQILGVKNVMVGSVGLKKEAEGQPAAEHSIEELLNRGMRLTDHRSRHIGSIGDLSYYDLILTVGEEEAKEIRAMFPEVAKRVEILNAEAGGIPNPWQLGPEAYRQCAEIIEKEMRKVAEHLKKSWELL